MRIATARDEMKKPVRTVSIKDGKFRKGNGKFRLYSYKNAGYAERVKTAALHTHIFRFSTVRARLPGCASHTHGPIEPRPGLHCRVHYARRMKRRLGAHCVPLGTLQTQLSDLGTMIRKKQARETHCTYLQNARGTNFGLYARRPSRIPMRVCHFGFGLKFRFASR